jgi:hypothetical protein
MVLSVLINMFLSDIDLVCSASAGSAISQNSQPSKAPTRTLATFGDRGPCFVEGQASYMRGDLPASMKTLSLFRLGAALKIAQDEQSSSYSHRDLSSAECLRYSARVTSLPRPRLHVPSSVRFQRKW